MKKINFVFFTILITVSSNLSFAQEAVVADKHACLNSNGLINEQDYGYLEFGQDDGNEASVARKYYKTLDKAYPEVLKRAKALANKVCKENPNLKKSKINGIRAEINEELNEDSSAAKYYGFSEGAFFCCK